MGSEQTSNQIEDVVGGLVWVRRRNGSWWPGRIMGLHELSENCLHSPRSGTPVKLLGRQDASVDWYNLEKSKRVKAFRCGEYDECIEKAKASAASSNKKAVKYARREDAILHALELEGTLDYDEHQTSQFKMNGSPSKIHEYKDEKESMPDFDHLKDANPTKELSQSGISFEDPDHVSTSQIHSLQKKRRKTPNDSEDDGDEGTKRMRGLEDLGVGVLSKQKASVRLNSEGSQELVQLDSALLSEPSICNSLSNESAITRSKGSCSFLKRRQSQVSIIHENLKRKNRRRPLTKVLESTAMVSVPVLCEQGVSASQSSLQGATDSKVSGLDSTDSKKTNILPVVNYNSIYNGASCDKETSLNASERTCDAHTCSDLKAISESPDNGYSDGLFDVPFVGDAKGTQGFSSVIASGASLKQSSEELDESGSTSLMVDVNSFRQKIAKRTSRWQLKGKRNLRCQGQKTSKGIHWRRSLEQNVRSDCSLSGKNHLDWYSGGSDGKLEINISDESLASDNYVRWSSRTSESSYVDSGRYGKRSSVNREGTPLDFLAHEKPVVAKDVYLNDGLGSSTIPQRSLPYRLSRFTPHPKYHDMDVPDRNTSGGSLFDVNIEVRANYRGQHVPLVSLMSKLNGKAIVGHPVTVEAWDDGYCDLLMSNIDCCPTSSNGELYDVPTENTSDKSMNVHRSSLLSDRCIKHADGPLEETGCKIKLKVPQHLRPQSSPSPKKSLKMKKSILLSKKTRKLSSFVAPMQNEEGEKTVVEKSGGPVVACVPLKVVFSRLHEALNGSRRPAADRHVTSSNP